MFRSLKKIKQLEEGQKKPKTKFHYYLCKFLIECKETLGPKSTLDHSHSAHWPLTVMFLRVILSSSQQAQVDAERERAERDQRRAQERPAERDASERTERGLFEEEWKQLRVCDGGSQDHLRSEAGRWVGSQAVHWPLDKPQR